MSPFPLSLRASAMLAITATSLSGQTIITEDMTSPSYFTSSLTSFSNPDDISYENYGTLPSGGNPGAYLMIDHEHDVDRNEFDEPINGDGSTFLQSYFIEQSTTYTPSTSGSIASLTFTIDYRTFDPFSEIFFDISDISGGSSGGFTSGLNTDGMWHTLTVTGLTQADFPSRDFSGSDPLSFGFGTYSSYDATSGPATFSMDVDNFTVTVVPVPEPTSPLLLAMGMGCLLLRRR